MYTVISINGGSPKWEATGLEEKGNKKRAEAILHKRIIEYTKIQEEAVKAQEEKKKYSGANVLFVDWMKDYIGSLGTAVRGSTVEGYGYRLAHIVNYFEDKHLKLKDVTAEHIKEFKDYLLSQGKLNKKTGERSGLAIRTVRSVKVLIVSAMNEAMSLGYITTNPASAIKVSKKSNAALAKKFNFMKTKELNALLDFMTDSQDEMTDIVKLISYYGLRRSEALGITLSRDSLDLENRRLYIHETVVKVATLHKEKNTKSYDSCREFEITDEMYGFFKRVIEKKEEDRKFYGNTFIDTPYLFTWEDGKPMNKFGRPNFTIHNLRHSAANTLYNLGWREWEIAEWFGHADPSTTKTWYAVLEKANNLDRAEKLTGQLHI